MKFDGKNQPTNRSSKMNLSETSMKNSVSPSNKRLYKPCQGSEPNFLENHA